MFSQINEQIEVLAHFSKKGAKPVYFIWRNQIYNIQSIDFIHTSYEGETKLVHFSVSTKTENYKLTFYTNTLTWMLNEIYSTKFEMAQSLNDRPKRPKSNTSY